MTIYKDDIKLFESKVMTDESDGGGAMAGTEIVSGTHNSIFPDISDLDRAYGVVGIRSVHLKVDSPNDETYYGATVGLIEEPSDPNVDVTLMSVNDPYIERDETKEIIERYLTSGVKYQGELFYDQVEGQRAIRIMQYASRSIPSAGEVLIVRNKQTGFEQYCKLVKVEFEDQSFYDGSNYTLRIVTCEISEPLRETLVGSAPNRFVNAINDSEVSETMIADASKYYGMKEITEDALFAESTIKADGIYNQLVPSARIDNAHVNVPIVENLSVPVAINAAGTEETSLPVNLESQSFPIDIDNQGYVFTQTLVPYPTKGALMVHYISQGNWYTLQDDGTGVLKGADDAHGTGTIDGLGNVSVTLGALPDITSELIFQWGSTAIKTELIQDADLNVNKTATVTLPTTPNNEDMTITWGVDKVATCANGVITGDATGTVRNDVIEFAPNVLPEPNEQISLSWTENSGGVVPSYTDETPIALTDTGTDYTFNYGDNLGQRIIIEVEPVDGNLQVAPAGGRNIYVQDQRFLRLDFKSDLTIVAQGGRYLDNDPNDTIVYGQSEPIGSYNPTTQDAVINKNLLSFSFTKQVWEKKRTHWWKSKSWTVVERQMESVPCILVGNEMVARREIAMAVTPPIPAGTYNFNFNSIKINFAARGTNLLEDTIKVNFNGRDLTHNNGLVSDGTNDVGTFNLTDQTMELSDWSTGNDTPTIVTGLYQYSVKQYVQDMVFLTAGNPVASRSLQVNAVDIYGTHCTGTADANGNITGGGFEGTIDTELGIVLLNNSNPVESADIKYNCVSYNYLPLDSEQLGLDPIRLPSDGRVAIFQKGDVVIIHQDEELSVTVTDGEVVDLNETRLVLCTSTANDAVFDLDAGTVTFPTAGTYDVNYRFEDMALLTYVDISGALKTSRPLSHTYTAGKAKVSSLLIAGDLFARYTNLFDQKTWTGDFEDSLVGDEAPVEYNDTAYPIQVTNDGCITERMAIVFTSSTNFKLIGENIGQIAVGDVNTDFAPINPTSGKPYFTLNKLGWGAGWSTNNVLRFDTYGAVYQMNIIRTILQGESEAPVDGDKFALQIRGNINKVV